MHFCSEGFAMNIKKYKSKRVKNLLKVREDELEPYFLFYLGEIEFSELSEMQAEKLERYRKAWSYYAMGRTKQMVIDALRKDYQIESRQAEYDLSASILLHGSLSEVDKDGRRVASAEYFDLLSQLALKDKQYIVALQARAKADEYYEIMKEEQEGHDPKDFMKPSKINFVVKVDNHYYAEKKNEIIELDE